MVRMIAEQDAGALAPVYAEIRTRLDLGLVPNIFKAMAAVNGDVLKQNWTAYRTTLLEGALPHTLKEMIGLVVAQRRGSPYLVQLHRLVLQRLGAAETVVADLLANGDSPDLSLRERAALRIAAEYSASFDDLKLRSLEAFGFGEEEEEEIADTVLMAASLAGFAQEAGLPQDAA